MFPISSFSPIFIFKKSKNLGLFGKSLHFTGESNDKSTCLGWKFNPKTFIPQKNSRAAIWWESAFFKFINHKKVSNYFLYILNQYFIIWIYINHMVSEFLKADSHQITFLEFSRKTAKRRELIFKGMIILGLNFHPKQVDLSFYWREKI